MDQVSPAHFLKEFLGGNCAAIDVRSPGEFAQGSLPGSSNLPLLNDLHRHEVGLTYHRDGQRAAIERGHHLVDALKPQLQAQWKTEVADRPLYVFCWRGGLRSQISLQWMQEAGLQGVRVRGGYQGIRRELLRTLEFPPPMVVLAGETGSGKTELLREFSHRVDLEELACHRGSVFGALPGKPQPPQTTFENALGLLLWQRPGPLLVEDESRQIGQCRLPHWFYLAKQAAPTVLLEEPLENRVDRIYRDYVQHSPLPAPQLQEVLERGLQRLRKPLGGHRFGVLNSALTTAFREGGDAHRSWIRGLLVEYYDPRYRWAMKKREQTQRFRGDREACRRWLQRKGLG